MSTKLGMSSPADVANLMAGVCFFFGVFVNVIFQVAPILRLLKGIASGNSRQLLQNMSHL